MLYAELIVITDGVVTKKFLENDDMPEDNVNEGDGVTDIEDWADVAAFVDHYTSPKTEAGKRTIPMVDAVEKMLKNECLKQQNNITSCTIGGFSGFVFVDKNGKISCYQDINKAIKRISKAYNAYETVRAEQEERAAVLLPYFTCHYIRHTFCTRLCEHETNLKLIQSIMGHTSIKTTMDIYAETTEKKKQETFETLQNNNVFFRKKSVSGFVPDTYLEYIKFTSN